MKDLGRHGPNPHTTLRGQEQQDEKTFGLTLLKKKSTLPSSGPQNRQARVRLNQTSRHDLRSGGGRFFKTFRASSSSKASSGIATLPHSSSA
eukprot:1976086-Rhodomonas_salina.3